MQLYIAHEAASRAPLSALKGFKRITLEPGASQKISFTITPELLALVDDNGNSVFQPGKVKIVIGDSSPGTRSEKLGAAKASQATLFLK